MTDDCFTAVATVLLAPLAVSTVRAEISLNDASSLTGSLAWSGEETRVGACLASEHSDAAGAVLDQAREPGLADDFWDSDQAVAAASKLAAAGVPFVVGHQRSPAATPALSPEHAGIGQARSRRKDDVERAAAIKAEVAEPGRI